MGAVYTWIQTHGGGSAWIIYPSLLVFALLAGLVSLYIARCTPDDFSPPPAGEAVACGLDSEDTHV